MRTEESHIILLHALKEKFPQKDILVKLLMDMLSLGKEAVYRRLRGEVPFSLADATIIHRKLNISLDGNLGCNFGRNRPFQLKLIQYHEPLDVDTILSKEFIEYFRNIEDASNSELGNAANILPQLFYARSESILKFLLFRWIYEYGGKIVNTPYHKTVLPENTMALQQEFLKQSQNVKKTYYILDSLMFMHIVTDIGYFSEIGLIQDADISDLKKELLNLLNFMERLAEKGSFDNGNKVEFYISNINIESNYSYIQNPGNVNLCLVRTFTLNPLVSTDKETFEVFKSRIHSLKKSSTLISESGESQRVSFFKKQRDYVNSL